MGIQCIEALKEYEETGYVNGYLPVNTKLIDAGNVDYYLELIQDEEEIQ